MKKIILLTAVLFLFAAGGEARTENVSSKEKIQVAILLDTSGSMQGLIEQAKSRLWNIVNTLTTLKYNGRTPDIEIALYEYGSYNRYDGDYIRQITPLTRDLDLISQELFVLTAGGSEEYCGTVIHKAVRDLEWGSNESDMKLVYIAGNEIFEQGKIPYKTSIKKAVGRNIYINTIHCGNRKQGIRDLWQDAALAGNGKFFNIDANAKVKYILTPYDDEISRCNLRLNETYIGYGRTGQARKENQRTQDANAQSISSANHAERTVSKSKSAYSNQSWDLVDKLMEDEAALGTIEKEYLPEELQDKTEVEIKAVVKQKETERAAIRKQISELAAKRQAYIDSQPKDNVSADDLGKAISDSILALAQAKGYAF